MTTNNPHGGAPPQYSGAPGAHIMRDMNETRDFRSIDMTAPEASAIRNDTNNGIGLTPQRTRSQSPRDGHRLDHEDSRDNRPLMKKDSRETDEFETDYQPTDWKALNKKMLKPKYIPLWIIGIALFVLTILMIVYHDKAVAMLRPWAEKFRDLPAGWLIPIAILFVISFPPLFGHELVALLCGIVWGLWIGFAIVAAGTFLGEIGTWFAFQKLLWKHCRKLERTNINYGALTRLARDSRFWFIFVVRFSAIPQHFSTAVFANCDINFWIFALATFLTLPKQLILVYFGTLIVSENDTKNSEFWIKTIVTTVSILITIVMGWWVYRKMAVVKKVLLREQEERRARKQGAGYEMGYNAAAYGQV